MNESSEETEAEDMEWLVQEYKKRKRKKKSFSNEQIAEIIGVNSQSNKNTSERNTQQKTSRDNSNLIQTNTQKTSTRINYSAKMKEISNKQYKFLYYINTKEEISRVEMADMWTQEISDITTDIILKTKKGFLLKSNTDKYKLLSVLSKLLSTKKIISYKETSPSTTPSNAPTLTITFSAVISNVEVYIEDKHISEHLSQQNISHRYCKRIQSRATGKETTLIRIITGCSKSYQNLLNNGVFYKNRHYPVYASNPPLPIPQPCKKCSEFGHTIENCNNQIKCDKCAGNHHPNKCDSKEPPKCVACGSEDHKAWSIKCPRRPTAPIEGVPNTTINKLNKRSKDINPQITHNTKIHSTITIHDLIINTYVTKINKPKNINREELITKLRKRFIQLYNIDTTLAFSGNKMYILMFDLDQPNSDSPTEPTTGEHNRQYNVPT